LYDLRSYKFEINLLKKRLIVLLPVLPGNNAGRWQTPGFY